MITDSVDTLVNMYINARNLFIAGKHLCGGNDILDSFILHKHFIIFSVNW